MGGVAPAAVATADGTTSAAWPAGAGRHAERFHDVAGAWTQARRRYAGGVGLRGLGRAAARDGTGVVRLLDVGTGLGWNLAAALDALAGTGARLVAVSLERDLAPLAFAAGLGRAGTGVAERRHREVRRALGTALAELDRRPAGPGLRRARVPLEVDRAPAGELELVLGDARAAVGALPPDPRFDAVFLDPFSPRVEPALWAPDFLAAVAARMTDRARLATYSAATGVRVALAAAGLAVARAPRVGGKAEGTVAGRDLAPPPADADLARRLARRLPRIPPPGRRSGVRDPLGSPGCEAPPAPHGRPSR